MKMSFLHGEERNRLMALKRYLEAKFRRYQIGQEIVLLNVPPAIARHMRFSRK
jgi:succinylglutamate desuccinylase